MQVCVESIIAQREFGMIFSATIITPGHAFQDARIRVKAEFAKIAGIPSVGETWEVEGDLQATRYGQQVHARWAKRAMPSGRLVQRFLAAHVPGIGEERAERLWQTFGEDLPNILSDEDNVEALAAVLVPNRPLLSARIAAACISAWHGAASETALITWLDQQGIEDVALARRIGRILGGEAVTRLSANPYVLVPLLPWAKVDALGLKLLAGGAPSSPRLDPRRLVGAADEAVKRALERGDTVLSTETFRHELGRLLSVSAGGERVSYAVSAAIRNEAVLEENGLWRAPGAAVMEEALAARLKELTRHPLACSIHVPPLSRLTELLVEVSDRSQPLHSEQADAVLKVLQRPVACLSGGAGTGKTYTCRVICDVWERLGGRVLPCALAGKAALRLGRSTRRLARTLARTLAELEERDRISSWVDDPYATDDEHARCGKQPDALAEITPRTLVVVDEASMVDLPTIYALVRRMPNGSRILFTGDEAQLPPCGFGLIYHRLVHDESITVRLTHVHRQAAATGIPCAAQSIRQRELPPLAHYQGRMDGVSFLDANDQPLDELVEKVAVDLGIFDGGALIVTATNGRAAGLRALNERLHTSFLRAKGVTSMGAVLGRKFAAGEPVIFGRNDYRLALFNGLLGWVTRTLPDENSLEVTFDGEDEPRHLGEELLIDLDLAFAVTCHKCQGSSAPRVIVPVYPSRVLDPSWLYTAVTRAERQVVLIGDRAVLQEALNRPFAADARCVGFHWPGTGE